MNPNEVFAYELETGRFFNKSNKLSYSRKKAEKVLLSGGLTEAAARQALDALEALGSPRAELLALSSTKPKKAAKVPMHQLYEDVKNSIPVLFYFDSQNTRQTFRVHENNRVSRVGAVNDDSIISALMADKPVWQQLKDYFHNDPMCADYRTQSFMTFMKDLCRNHLFADEEKVITAVPPALSISPTDYSFHKINLATIVAGPTPAWDEFLNRTDQAELFMAWVWSIIEPTNTVRQLLWMKGPGQDGKSSVQKALMSFLGVEACAAMKDVDSNNQFFLGNVEGKVLLTYPDCSTSTLLYNDYIRAITGGDIASIERKGQQAYAGSVKAKVFVTSNKFPRINPRNKHQVSRLLLVTVKPATTNDATFENRLIAEMPAFMYRCQQMWDKHANIGKDNINISAEQLAFMTANCKSRVYIQADSFWRNYMQFNPDSICLAADLSTGLAFFCSKNNVSAKQREFIENEIQDMLSNMGIDLEDDAGTMLYEGFSLSKEILIDPT